MSGRKVADRPDPVWVASIRAGDLVSVAQNGVVLREDLEVRSVWQWHITAGGYVFRETGYEKVPRMQGSRYLVPVASSPDKEGA